uniref:Uncharacterized protein n=1 Tax=Solanum lycopersicum TaxID=4081 RepID=A0A3Q7G4U3_SOLLC
MKISQRRNSEELVMLEVEEVTGRQLVVLRLILGLVRSLSFPPDTHTNFKQNKRNTILVASHEYASMSLSRAGLSLLS